MVKTSLVSADASRRKSNFSDKNLPLKKDSAQASKRRAFNLVCSPFAKRSIDPKTDKFMLDR